MPALVGCLLGILLLGLILQRFGQPTVVGYLLAGVLLGPSGLSWITDAITLSRLGTLGVVLLLFFVGMEISLPRLMGNWRVCIFGTFFQTVASVACVWVVGVWFDWPLARIVLLGFVISLSSTAVVMKILQDSGEIEDRVGQNVVGILLTQDLAFIPMLIIIGFLSGTGSRFGQVTLQVCGAAGIMALLIFLAHRPSIKLPFGRVLRDNHEMQVFAALIICLGISLVTALTGLSTALGAFVAGIVVAAARETRWIHENLQPLRVVFVALFFVSVGMLLDLRFLVDHLSEIGLLVAVVFLANTLINMFVLRFLGSSWPDSLYAGALLSQIGEFSFVLAAVGRQAEIITEFAYQMTMATIVLTLLLTAFWAFPVRRWTTRVRFSHACDASLGPGK
jgi:CPA2 family monovalent cation:H+ antiporter-2